LEEAQGKKVKKFQNTKKKIQTSSNCQKSKYQTSSQFEKLGFEEWDLFVIWHLKIGNLLT
jgi:hypothetical protein